MPEFRKREIAYKLRVGDLIKANPIFDEAPKNEGRARLLHLELGEKRIVRVNLIANVIDKFESGGEKRFASITVDDGSGQIKARVFGEDLIKLSDIVQGDTVLIIGLMRSFNDELYVLPEIIRKQDPKYLLVRKLELDKINPPVVSESNQANQGVKSYRDEVIDLIKASEESEGIDKEEIIMKFKSANKGVITQEIQKLLEEGIIYEPRPGRVRYLG
ncbi:hypothetical protein CMI42_03005 [Candidatus Pacearchaeota archaeon]|nr:hypothetical protein [Candidatus Pacearchaeota archaeon]